MQKQEFKNLARELKSNLSKLMEKRSTWESHWRECADFTGPNRPVANTQGQDHALRAVGGHTDHRGVGRGI